MTLSDLYRQIKDIGNLFNTWDIPMDKEIHLELQDDNTVKVNVNQWISVDEELPKEDGDYIVTKYKDEEHYITCFAKWNNNKFNTSIDITHWMPIPELNNNLTIT